MKKFMKFCFVLALMLIIVGGVFYTLGRKTGGREEMNELLEDFGGEWVDLDGLLQDRLGSYSIEEASIFSEDYEIWKGNVYQQVACDGSLTGLNLEIGGSMVEIKKSDDENIHIEGESVGKMQAYMEGGVLYVKSVRPANLAEEIKSSRITLYLPQTTVSLEEVAVSLGAGQLQFSDMEVQNMVASVGAGQLVLERLALGYLNVSLGAGELRTVDVSSQFVEASVSAGNMDYSGTILESANISCSMGNVSMALEGEREDYNYQLNCAAGNMEIDGESYAGAAVDRYIDNGAVRLIEIDCAMGNVEVGF